jgi:HD domain-containing protein
MNRRDILGAFATLYLGASFGSRTAAAISAKSWTTCAMTATDEPLPSSVAGVRLVDSKIARLATDFSRSAYPPYLFNHAIRTFLFGSLVGRALGQAFDEETLYLACILHDLGLTEKFQGESPFEIQGAETARRFLEEQGYAKEKVGVVWDGIAMHASPIGQFKQPEIALVGEGAGADVIAPDFSQIKKSDVEEIVKAFPRLKFKDAFVKTCADVIRRHPRAASSSFMRDIRERYVPEFHPRNFCDRVVEAPFTE